MRRREFITLLGGAAASWPLAARAQQSAMPLIGFLSVETPELRASYLRALRQGLSDQDYVEGRNFAFELRWAEGRSDRLRALAADLVRRKVAVLVAAGTPPALAAKAATSTIPILFDTGGDPVELLVNPANPNGDALTREVQGAARGLGLQLHVLNASTERDFEPAFATLTHMQAEGLVIATDGLFFTNGEQLGALVLRHRLPAIFAYHEFAAAGGLMSYGGNLIDQFRLLGVYAGRILKGERPADLPVQQVTKVELIINMKTAKALGITVPLPLLGRADEVIE